MGRKRLFKASLFLGVILFIGLHLYYPHDPSVVIGKASLVQPKAELSLNSVFSFFFAIIVEYLVIVFCVYVFLRSVLKTFEKKMSRRVM